MAELAVDLTYGTALVEAAREVGKENQILEEAQAVVQLIEDEPDLHQFINYPGVSADEKKEVLKNIFEGRICEELLNFLYILVDKRRTMNFGRIIKVYKSKSLVCGSYLRVQNIIFLKGLFNNGLSNKYN